MEPVNANRLRWGALAWLLTLQFFLVETIAQFRFEGSYSRADDTISALGTGHSAAHQLMNASFVLQAGLILVGALLLRPRCRRPGCCSSGPSRRTGTPSCTRSARSRTWWAAGSG